MAGLDQVEDALVNAVTAGLYPSGIGVASVLGVDCRIYRGWPMPKGLADDLTAGKVNVSIYAQPGVERNTTRFPADWKTLAEAAPQIRLTIAGPTVTVGGAIQAGDVATVKIGGRAAYSVGVQANSTLASIASALAALIAADTTATSSGAVVTIPSGGAVTVAVGGLGTSWRELRRQAKGFQVTVWASSPAQRDAAASAVDNALALVELAGFLSLADGSAARLTYVQTREGDAPQKEKLWRRELFYLVEYPTIQTRSDTSITAVAELVKGSGSPADAPAVTSIK